MKKKLLALLLTVAMMVTFLPFSALVSAEDSADDGIAGVWWETQDDGRTYQPNSYSTANNPNAGYLYNFSSVGGLYTTTYGGEGFVIGPHSASGKSTDGTKTASQFKTRAEAIAAGCTSITTSTTQPIHEHNSKIAYKPDDLTNVDFGKDPYVAIRLMFKNNSNEVDYDPARLTIAVGDVGTSGGFGYCTDKYDVTSTDASGNSITKTMLWLDANDASCTKVYSQSINKMYNLNNSANYGISFMADMNGYLLIPISMFSTATSITDVAAYLKTEGSKLSLQYVGYKTTTTTAGTKADTWANKELYIGNILILNDKDKFVTNFTKENDIKKYSTGYDDSAVILQRAPAYTHHSYNNYKVAALYATDRYDATSGNFMHVASLPNGDAAYDITARTHQAASYNIFPNMNFTYDDSNPGISSSKPNDNDPRIGGSANTGTINGGIAAEAKAQLTDLTNAGVAIRVATFGNEGKTITFRPCISHSSTLSNMYYTLNGTGVDVQFIDAETGKVTPITLQGKGVPLTGNLDGWIVIPGVKAPYWVGNWTGYMDTTPGVAATVTGLDADETSAQKIYMGDVRMFSDYERYMKVHTNDTSLDIRYVSLTLEDNLSVNVKINRRKYEDKYGIDVPNAKFTYSEIEQDATGTLNGQKYVFTLKGVAVQRMGDAIEAQVFDSTGANSGKTLSEVSGPDYSIKQYCLNMFNDSSSTPAFKTLLTDLLNYGAAAQKYSGYKTNELVNADESIDQSLATAELAEVKKETSLIELEGAALTWKSAALRLTDTVEIKVSYNGELSDKTGMYVSVTDAAENEIFRSMAVQSGTFYIDCLNADQMRDTIYITLYNSSNEAVSGTLVYSIEDYVANRKDDPEVGELVTAMMKYGDAAAAYRAS